MQYVHRKLQRSVTEIRRSWSGRPRTSSGWVGATRASSGDVIADSLPGDGREGRRRYLRPERAVPPVDCPAGTRTATIPLETATPWPPTAEGFTAWQPPRSAASASRGEATDATTSRTTRPPEAARPAQMTWVMDPSIVSPPILHPLRR